MSTLIEFLAKLLEKPAISPRNVSKNRRRITLLQAYKDGIDTAIRIFEIILLSLLIVYYIMHNP